MIMEDLGGWLWLTITVGMVAVLGVVLAYGISRSRRSAAGGPVAPEYREREPQ